jgi:hypothetical protein
MVTAAMLLHNMPEPSNLEARWARDEIRGLLETAAMSQNNEQRTTNNEKPVSIPLKKINISSNLLCILIFPLRPGLGSLSHSL